MNAVAAKTRRVRIDQLKLAPLEVEARATFNRRIDGKMFRFAVTRNVQGHLLQPVVTELRTGRKICELSARASYVRAFRALAPDYKQRGKMALEALIDRCSGNSMMYDGGAEAYVRSVIERAPECGAEYEKNREGAE